MTVELLSSQGMTKKTEQGQKLYLLKNFYREDPLHVLHFEKSLDKLHAVLIADLTDQVDAEPVVVALATQLHHSGQEGSDYTLAFTLSLCVKKWK